MTDRQQMIEAMEDMLANLTGPPSGLDAAYVVDVVFAPALAEAERRGAERGWDRGVWHLDGWLSARIRRAAHADNPYRTSPAEGYCTCDPGEPRVNATCGVKAHREAVSHG